MKPRGKEPRIRRWFMGLLVGFVLLGSQIAVEKWNRKFPFWNIGPASAQTSGNVSASAVGFTEASKVFLHPRCVNCHPRGDAPLIGDNSRPHPMRVRRGPEGMGENGMRCSGCHQAKNLPGPHLPPGAPGWQLPPRDTPMVFEKRTPRELCLQLKDPAQNGNRTPEEILEHVREAPIVLWGWDPGQGRTPVSVPHQTFVNQMTEWVKTGAACPE